MRALGRGWNGGGIWSVTSGRAPLKKKKQQKQTLTTTDIAKVIRKYGQRVWTIHSCSESVYHLHVGASGTGCRERGAAEDERLKENMKSVFLARSSLWSHRRWRTLGTVRQVVSVGVWYYHSATDRETNAQWGSVRVRQLGGSVRDRRRGGGSFSQLFRQQLCTYRCTLGKTVCQ